jgi:hypothetical protein
MHTYTVRASTAVCTNKSQPAVAGNPAPGTCVIEPASGGRYQCPISATQRFGADDDQAATNSACHKVTPPRVPATWRPTLRRLDATKMCLRRAGITAKGGSSAGFQSHPNVPVGALLIAGTGKPTAIIFYLSDKRAAAAYRRFQPNVSKEGGTMARGKRVVITWGSTPGTSIRAAVARCTEIKL